MSQNLALVLTETRINHIISLNTRRKHMKTLTTTNNNGRYATIGNVTWDPSYGAIEPVIRQLPALFNESWFDSMFGNMTKAFDAPNAVYPYNVKAIKNLDGVAEKYIVEVALAGIGKENIDVKVRDGHLYIDILKEEKLLEEEDSSFVKKGISKRKGHLSFALNENTDVKNITSTYTDGLLRVTVPVTQPEFYNIDIKVD